jgi:transposase
MRGDAPQQAALFSDLSPAARVPNDHPRRTMRALGDGVLKERSRQFDTRYSPTGRPSMAPEKWLRALLLPVRDPIRRERRRMEPLDDPLLVRWCVGLNRDDAVWDPPVFRTNRARLRAGEVAQACFDQGLAQARKREWRSDAHCTGDGPLREAWAGQKSCQRKEAESPSPPPDAPGTPRIADRGARRTHATHASTTAPAARLCKKATGQEAKWAYRGPVRMEHRHGLGVDTRVTQATGTAEREAALALAEGMPGQQRVTWGAEKHDAPRAWVRELREPRVTPHVAQHTAGRSSARDGRTTRHPGDAVRQRQRTCGEEIFAWLKPVGLRRKVRHRGVGRVGWLLTFAAAVYHVGRMRTLPAAA